MLKCMKTTNNKTDTKVDERVEEECSISDLTLGSATSEEETTMPNEESELSQLIKLLTLKIKNEEAAAANDKISADNFEKVIPEYNGKSIAVSKWIENFERNAEAYGLSEKQKFVQARAKMTETAKLLLDSVTVSNYTELKTCLLEEFTTEYSSADVHKLLMERKKKENETFCDFILEMRKIAMHGDVDNNSLIRYIVDGLRLKSEQKLFLYRCKSIKELKQEYEICDRINKSEQQKAGNKAINRNNNNNNTKKEHCFNCGSTEHRRKECKAPTKCFRCNKPGHISSNCSYAEKTENKNVNTVMQEDRIKQIRVNNVDINCLIDTGSDVTILAKSEFDKINVRMYKNNTMLFGFGNAKTIPLGQCKCIIEVDNFKIEHDILIVTDGNAKFRMILGYDFVRKFYYSAGENGYIFNGIKPTYASNIATECNVYNIVETPDELNVSFQFKNAVKNMVDEYNPTVSNKESDIKLIITPDVNMKPFHQAPSRLPPIEQEAVKSQVDEWLQQGIVRKSNSEYASRVVVVRKKNGKFRVCVDFRKLNAMVLKDRFPMPVVEDVLVKLQTAKYYTVMDLENGFFHLPIEETSKRYTAFITKEGLFEFNKAPFGFCNSPAVFIRYVNHIFQNLINEDIMEMYIDDIVVYAENSDDCLRKMKIVLNTAAQWGLRINWKKCSFMQTKIDFLGHIVENGKIWPGSDKVKAIHKFPVPSDIRSVQSFLGLTGYFRKFIKGYAQIARPLTDLLKKDVPFKVDVKQLDAVNQLKNLLTQEPVLRIYCWETHTELHTDASIHGFGAVLLQQFEGQLHPVAFWSKKSSERESKQHSYILEVKAAYLATKKFRHYLLGIKFKLVTDCSAFKYTLTKPDIPREVAQWIMQLQDYSFEVEHRNGKNLQHVDSLSRNPQILYITTEVSARLRHAQRQDEHLKAIHEILKDRPYENFKIRGDILFKNVNGAELLVVPKAMEREIIRSAHEVGHFSTQKTTHAIQQYYWIPHLEAKVNQLIKNCIKCIIHNRKSGKKEELLHCIDKGEVPLHTLHVDHLGPMDATAKQYKYIFAIVDSFTKFVWLYPTKSTGQEEVVRKLSDWSNIFGYPTRLVSDRGAAFVSNAFEEFNKTNGIEHILTTTGVPRGNGQIERVNRTILSVIAKLAGNDSKTWYRYVAEVQKAINCSVHSSTKSSPFELLFGTRMKGTNSQVIDAIQAEIHSNFEENRQRLRERARTEIIKAQANYKANYDKKCKESHKYKVGDLVAIKRTQFIAGKKLASQFLGPYEVINVKRHGRYDVRKTADVEGPINTSTSSDNMKLWRYVEVDEDLSSSGSDEE